MTTTVRTLDISTVWIIISVYLLSGLNPITVYGFTQLQATLNTACIGEEVTLSCATSYYTIRWHVRLSDRTALPLTRLFRRTDVIGRNYLTSTNELWLNFTLISNTMGVINSTLVIRVTTALADASIKCEGTATRRYVLKIASKPTRPTNITQGATTYNRTASNVTLSWNMPTAGRVDMYHVNVSYKPNHVTKYFTNTPAVRVEGIPYDLQVAINITADNCHSESEAACFKITIKRCNKTAPINGHLARANSSSATVTSIPGEEIMFTCNDRYAPQDLTTAVCEADGVWHPNPRTTLCLIECKLPALNKHLVIDNESLNSTLIVEGAELHFKCQNGLKFIENGLRSSLCSKNGVWVPDPEEYECQIEDIQQINQEQAILISGCVVGLFFVASAFLFVSVCITKHCTNKQRNMSAREDLRATESIYDTTEPDYAVIRNERKETKFTVNDAYNF